MAWRTRTWQALVLIVVVCLGAVLGAILGREPGRPGLTGCNPWQCRGLSLGAALLDRHRHDRHIVALLAQLAAVAVDVREDRLDDVLRAASRGPDPAREPRQAVLITAGVARFEDAGRH